MEESDEEEKKRCRVLFLVCIALYVVSWYEYSTSEKSWLAGINSRFAFINTIFGHNLFDMLQSISGGIWFMFWSQLMDFDRS